MDVQKAITQVVKDSESALGHSLALWDLMLTVGLDVQASHVVEKIEIRLIRNTAVRISADPGVLRELTTGETIDLGKGPTVLELEPGVGIAWPKNPGGSKDRRDDDDDMAVPALV